MQLLGATEAQQARAVSKLGADLFDSLLESFAPNLQARRTLADGNAQDPDAAAGVEHALPQQAEANKSTWATAET